MKTSASTPTGEEMLQDIGCKFVCCLYLFGFSLWYKILETALILRYNHDQTFLLIWTILLP